MATITRKPLNVAKLRSFFEGASDDALNAAKDAADLLLERALPLTPMDTGALRESGRTEVERKGNKITAKVIFGNEETIDYAAVVHEDMQPKNWTTEGTGPKYLETAVDQTRDEIEELIGNTFDASIKKMAKEQ